jgi:hypothetical protein
MFLSSADQDFIDFQAVADEKLRLFRSAGFQFPVEDNPFSGSRYAQTLAFFDQPDRVI